MRIAATATVLALALVGPAAAITGHPGVSGALKPGQLVISSTGVVSDKSKSCQAGEKQAAKAGLLGGKKRTAVVACEQPPRANLMTPDQIAKATASALSILG